jgi:hypothetical protein
VGRTDPVRENKRPIPELRNIPVNDRDVIISYDSDVSRNRAVRNAVIAPVDRSRFAPSLRGHFKLTSRVPPRPEKTLALGKGFCPSRTRKR